MQCSESRKEATRLTPLLTPRTLTRLATRNIWTMYETRKTVQVAREMKRYKIRVIGLCETRWIQSGQLRLSSGEQLLYSGCIEEGAPHTEGVALMLAPEAHAALIGWEPVSSCIITAKNGNPLTTTDEQLKRWAEHFRELLNCPTPDSPPDIPPAETELPISCDKPSKTEIKKAIMTLKSGKAAGPDEIPAEAIKADIETAVQMLYSLFSKIWEKEEVPAQWKEGINIKLP